MIYLTSGKKSDKIKRFFNMRGGMPMQVIDKTDSERIQIEMKSYKGKEYMDIRIFFKSDEGEWLPTKKGVTVGLNKLNDFIEAFKKEQATKESE
jgi:hypothetical protein